MGLKWLILERIHLQTPIITAFPAILSVPRIIVSTAVDSPIFRAYQLLNDIRGLVNALLNTETFDPLLTRAAEVIERHSVLFGVNRILKPIL